MEREPSNENPKRQKTLIPKGKEKIEEGGDQPDGDDDDRTADATCGICLSDASRSIRGRIDSCGHYFCFLCIMEWAKVENRCPMCKKRFCSIARPSAAGRLVPVPERNQVYNHTGSGSVASFDPYADVVCSECHNANNEELLLLCDLCDMASHTYCVGLGATVPEGDWYCRDCAIVRTEHSKTQTDSDSCINDSYNKLKAISAPRAHVSNFGIVSDDFESTQGALTEQPLRQQRKSDRPPTIRNSISHTESRNPAVSVGEIISSPGIVEQNARTLQRSRNVQSHIRVLRENWNALRSGSLVFSSSSLDSSSRDHVEGKNNSRATSDASRYPDSMSSGRNKQSVDATTLKKTIHSADSQDVSKAWQNMQKAKAIEGDLRGAVSSPPLKLSDNKPHLFVSIGYTTPSSAVTGHAKAVKYSSFNLAEKHRSPHHEKEKVGTQRKIMQNNQREQTRTLLGYMKSSSFKHDRNPHLEGTCDGNKGLAPLQLHKELAKCYGGVTLKHQGSTISSLSGPSKILASNPIDPSSCKMDPSKGKKAVASANGDTIKINENSISAKGDIQSLVKLNLKLLCGGRSLGQEVAELVKNDFGTIDILVHSLANGPEVTKPLLETSRHGYLAAISASSYSFVSLLKYFLPIMNPGGATISLTYIASERTIPGYGGGMSSAKAALESDTRILAFEAGRAGQIRVNTISAGPLGSRAAKAIGFIEKMINYSYTNAPLRKELSADEVGTTAAFLASPLASAVTGSVVYVDNGLNTMGLASDSPSLSL